MSKYINLFKDNSTIKFKYKDKTLNLCLRMHPALPIIYIFTLDKKDICIYTGNIGNKKDTVAFKLWIERLYTRS